MLSVGQFENVAGRRVSRLVVAFGGVKQGYGGIKGEFRQSLSRLGCASLFVTDEGRRWYQYPDADLDALCLRIKEHCAEIGASRLVCLGNSMGGFGALLLGGRLNADAALAFSPQTVIEPAGTSAIGDERWSEYQTQIDAYPHGDLLREPAVPQTVICWGADDALDVAHGERIARPWRADTVPVPGARHDAAWVLRERGELLPLLEEVIAG